MRTIFILSLAAAAVAAPLQAQRAGDVPRRPRLAAAADTNDAAAYYRLGQERLERSPEEAAAAFYWAAQLDPAWADPLYGRHVALLMSNPRRLVRYWDGDRSTRMSAEVLAIDSLYFRALRIDPFVQQPFERELVRALVMNVLGADAPGADGALASYYTETIMQDMPPLLRARVLAGEGRMQEALRAYDQALRENRGRRSETRRYIRHERARMFGLIGNDSAALAELQQAIDMSVEEEREELIRFYDSKAVLEHSRGMMLERAGDAGAAREAYARALLEDLAYHPAHVRMGALALAEGDTATAVQEMALAVEAGQDPVTRVLYAMLLTRVRRLDDAQAELQAAAAAAPHWAEPWYMLGLVRDWGAPGDAAEAYRRYMERARRSDPRREQVESLLSPSGG